MTGVMVVDDDRPLARSLAINLRAHGYQVTLAHTGQSALTEITRTHPDVVVLDLGLPDLDGIEVLTGIRCSSTVSVIVLSARSTSAQKSRGPGRRRRRLRHQTLRYRRTPRPHPGVRPPRHPDPSRGSCGHSQICRNSKDMPTPTPSARLLHVEHPFKMLLMRSSGAFADDLTTRARIRDAAVGLIGRDGFDALTVRVVAEAAGVSPGLVIHYFGSKDGLRTECEEYVGDRIHDAIEQATASLQPYDLFGEMSRKVELAPLVPYLLRALAEGGDLGRRMFGRVVDDTERYLAAAVVQGAIRPSEDERGRAEMLTSFSLGSQLLAQYLVTADSPEGRVEELQRRFTVPALEVFTQGLYTSTEIADRFRDQSWLGDDGALIGSPGRSRRTEPNAPAGDPPGLTNSEQGSPSQPAA